MPTIWGNLPKASRIILGICFDLISTKFHNRKSFSHSESWKIFHSQRFFNLIEYDTWSLSQFECKLLRWCLYQNIYVSLLLITIVHIHHGKNITGRVSTHLRSVIVGRTMRWLANTSRRRVRANASERMQVAMGGWLVTRLGWSLVRSLAGQLSLLLYYCTIVTLLLSNKLSSFLWSWEFIWTFWEFSTKFYFTFR